MMYFTAAPQSQYYILLCGVTGLLGGGSARCGLVPRRPAGAESCGVKQQGQKHKAITRHRAVCSVVPIICFSLTEQLAEPAGAKQEGDARWRGACGGQSGEVMDGVSGIN